MIQKAPISMIMTKDVITLNKTDNLEAAEQLFKRHKIRHIPIVSDHKIIGILSYTDLLRLSFADITNDDSSADDIIYNLFSIEQVMKSTVDTVSSANSIKEVAEILATKEFHALPVVDNNILVGIVTTTDLINYLIKQF